MLFVFYRTPQDILETECICTKCLTSCRNALSDDYWVFPIMVTRYFMWKGKENTIFNAKFSIGCLCEKNNPEV